VVGGQSQGAGSGQQAHLSAPLCIDRYAQSLLSTLAGDDSFLFVCFWLTWVQIGEAESKEGKAGISPGQSGAEWKWKLFVP
jgi:hypothetical protein